MPQRHPASVRARWRWRPAARPASWLPNAGTIARSSFEDASVGTADDLRHFDGAPMIFRAHVRSRVDCLSLPVLASALAASTPGLGAAAFPPNVTVAHAGCHVRHVGPGRACGPAAAESHASPTYESPVWPIWSPAIPNRRRPARRATFIVCDCSVCSTRSSRTASEGAGQRRGPLRRGKGARHVFSRSKPLMFADNPACFERYASRQQA